MQMSGLNCGDLWLVYARAHQWSVYRLVVVVRRIFQRCHPSFVVNQQDFIASGTNAPHNALAEFAELLLNSLGSMPIVP